MRNLFLFLSTILLCVSCIEKNPQLDETKYLAMQKEYEIKKKEISTSKITFFKDQQEVLTKKLDQFRKVKDSANKFAGVSTDSTFYLRNATIKLENFPYFLGRNYVPERQPRSQSQDSPASAVL